jgi:hypothetical protein
MIPTHLFDVKQNFLHFPRVINEVHRSGDAKANLSITKSPSTENENIPRLV